jgi:hypothetical protein
VYTYRRSNICNATVKKKKKKKVFKTNVSVDYLFKHDGDVCLCDKRVFIRFLVYREQTQELQTSLLVSYRTHDRELPLLSLLLLFFFRPSLTRAPLAPDRRVHYTPKPVQTVLQWL